MKNHMSFLAKNKTFVPNSKIEYFKVLQNIYSNIISKRNSSVSKIFVNAFQLSIIFIVISIYKINFSGYLPPLIKNLKYILLIIPKRFYFLSCLFPS